MLTDQPERPFHAVWLELLAGTLSDGRCVRPRGMQVRERVAVTASFDGNRALLVHPARGLNYRFAAAEAVWIAAGLEDLAPLVRYNKEMARFSDDGVTLGGAYGPRLALWLPYVLDSLRRDGDSRQAMAVVWQPHRDARPSKDKPCTVDAQFLVRDGALHSVWHMRSNDLWLGLPYDAYSFSRFAACVAGELGVPLGNVSVVAGSSHLYEEHWAAAAGCCETASLAWSVRSGDVSGFPPPWVVAEMREPHSTSAYTWPNGEWARFAEVFRCRTKAEALEVLAGPALFRSEAA